MKLAMPAILSGLRTTVDGGIKLTFDTDLQNAQSMGELLQLQGNSLYLVIMNESDLKEELITDAAN